MQCHTHTCMLYMINMDASMEAALCNFYKCIFYHYACVCMCMHVGIPQTHPQPHPQEPGGPQIIKNAVKLEQIKIISIPFEDLGPLYFPAVIRTKFSMQVGVSHPKMTFLCFGPKNIHAFCSCEIPSKKCPVFTLEPDRPCLD